MKRIIVCAVALAMASCGQKDKGTTGTGAQAGQGAVAASATPATARQPKADCGRAKQLLQSSARPAFDILGITTGMSEADATALLRCHETGYAVTVGEAESKFALPEMPDGTPTQGLITASTKEEPCDREEDEYCETISRDVIEVSLLGMPGERKVLSVRRVFSYPPAKRNTLANTRATLEEKYGPSQPSAPQHENEMQWLRTPTGEPVRPNNWGIYYPCGSLNSSFSGGNTSFSNGCGRSVVAVLTPTDANPEIARGFTLTAADQAAAYDMLTATQRAVEAAILKKHNAEVTTSTQQGARPSL